MKTKLTMLALATSTFAAAGADYTFNSGNNEGWTYRLVEYSTSSILRSGAAGWSDINNYAKYLTDPVGDNQGAAQAALSAADYSGASSGDYLLIQFVSPDLTTSSDWQGASAFSAKLLPSFTADALTPDVYANLAVVVNDLDLGTERSFVNGTAVSLASATWTDMDFDLAPTFASASPAVVHYEVKEVIVTFWIAVSASRFVADPLIFDIDNVSTGSSSGENSALDFGDAPDDGVTFQFRTLLAHDGARHEFSTLRLGKNWDAESDGQPDIQALLDDKTGVVDDEDGVRMRGVVFDPASGTPVNVPVFVSGGSGILDAWIDWNRDFTWTSPEHAIAGVSVTPGWNLIPVTTPGIPDGLCYARFRLTSAGSTNWYGLEPDGEVEDYRVRVRAGGADNNPRLRIRRTGGSLRVEWDEDGMSLQKADSPLGPWTPVSATGSPYNPTNIGQQRFFRLLDEIQMGGE